MALCVLWAAEAKTKPELLSAAIQHSLPVFGHSRVKPVQAEAVQAALQGKDVLVTVPTGYGKSLIYQMLPLCASFLLETLGKSVPTAPLVLVVSPLIALMQDQAKKLSRVAGVVPLLLTEDTGHMPGDGGDWTHILASPEALLESPRGRKLLLSSDVVNSLVAVVVDEAHCIVKW